MLQSQVNKWLPGVIERCDIGESGYRSRIYLGKRNGVLAFDAEVLYENKPMLSIFEKARFQIVSSGSVVYYLKLAL